MRKLLLQIARCPVLESVLDDPTPAHPCAAVALEQWGRLPPEDRPKRWRGVHQTPEPWIGHLREAPLLFVSSNPSIGGKISRNPDAPAPGRTWNEDDETLVERYEDAFDKFIVDGIRHRTGERVHHWIEVRSRAKELMDGRTPKPGHDYALTEVVHCKSLEEGGVDAALATCSGLYLKRTILASGARVVIFLGTQAEWAAWHILRIPTSFGIKRDKQHVLRYRLGKRERLVGFLPHTNHRGQRTAKNCWKSHELSDVRRELSP